MEETEDESEESGSDSEQELKKVKIDTVPQSKSKELNAENFLQTLLEVIDARGKKVECSFNSRERIEMNKLLF